MSKTKPGTDFTLPAQGGRVTRTIQHEDGSHVIEFQCVDTNGRMHPDEPPLRKTSAEVVAWITNAINNPGTDAEVDALVAANPTFALAHIAVARQLLFLALESMAGFSES